MSQFANISRFEITASCAVSGKTFIEDSFFTSPFKIMKPFAKEDGSISVFLQSGFSPLYHQISSGSLFFRVPSYHEIAKT